MVGWIDCTFAGVPDGLCHRFFEPGRLCKQMHGEWLGGHLEEGDEEETNQIRLLFMSSLAGDRNNLMK